MRQLLKISFTLILILIFIGCKKDEKKEQKPVVKKNVVVQTEFGKWNEHNESLGVELNFKKFDNWNDLVKRAGNIVCNDSIPKVTIKTNNHTKIIYFQHPCWESGASKPVKSNNVLEIDNDTIFKPKSNTFPLDSLESVLTKDIHNNGLNPYFSESPKKLVISITYDKESDFKNLGEILDRLTQQYYSITNKTDIKIWLTDKEFLKPPKPFKNNQID
jgi:hypothetical protein